MFSAALERQRSLGEYALQHLFAAAETREAMQFSRRHYLGLMGLADAFKHADQGRTGQLTFSDFQRLFANDKNQVSVRCANGGEVCVCVADNQCCGWGGGGGAEITEGATQFCA
jgi:hypothetical protein